MSKVNLDWERGASCFTNEGIWRGADTILLGRWASAEYSERSGLRPLG